MEKTSMGNGIEGIGKINVEDVKVPRERAGVIEGKEKSHQLANSVVPGAEAFLMRVEKAMGLRIGGDERR